MNTENSITVLNKFLSFQNERFENYDSSILETYEKDLKDLLFKYKEECFYCKSTLIDEIKKLGGFPIEDTVTSKKFIHFWIDFKHVFVQTKREDLLAVFEYNEFLNIKKFNKLLQNNMQHLNFTQLQMLKKQLVSLEENHDYLKSLGEAYLKNSNIEEIANY